MFSSTKVTPKRCTVMPKMSNQSWNNFRFFILGTDRRMMMIGPDIHCCLWGESTKWSIWDLCLTVNHDIFLIENPLEVCARSCLHAWGENLDKLWSRFMLTHTLDIRCKCAHKRVMNDPKLTVSELCDYLPCMDPKLKMWSPSLTPVRKLGLARPCLEPVQLFRSCN